MSHVVNLPELLQFFPNPQSAGRRLRKFNDRSTLVDRGGVATYHFNRGNSSKGSCMGCVCTRLVINNVWAQFLTLTNFLLFSPTPSQPQTQSLTALSSPRANLPKNLYSSTNDQDTKWAAASTENNLLKV
jgi:hypothetical protein